LRLCGTFSSRHIARLVFVVVAAGLTLLAVVVRNEWETSMVIFGLIMIGLGQGALATLLFTTMAAMAVVWPDHHAVASQPDRVAVGIFGGMYDGDARHVFPLRRFCRRGRFGCSRYELIL
jgi:hypothetical protein